MAIWRRGCGPGTVGDVEERERYEDDRQLLFIVLFDLRALLARLVAFVEGGGDDGQEEEGEAEDPEL